MAGEGIVVQSLRALLREAIVSRFDGFGNRRGLSLPSIDGITPVPASFRRRFEILDGGENQGTIDVAIARLVRHVLFNPPEERLFSSRVVPNHGQHFASKAGDDGGGAFAVASFEALGDHVDGTRPGESEFVFGEDAVIRQGGPR